MLHITFHCDFHHAKRRVLTAAGEWKTPILLGFLDDHSRLGCHLQWYLAETAEVFVHGLCQGFMKRGLPRALMSDNGSPMIAGEVTEGLHRLGILHSRTLAGAPYMNGKLETYWASVEGRLMAMAGGRRGAHPEEAERRHRRLAGAGTTTAASTASSA